MPIRFDTIEIGRTYDRPFLADLWGYQSHHAFSRGVFTPRDANMIVLFVTKEKQNSQTQYNDFIDGEHLFWEGEEKHASDKRIVGARAAGTPIQLFYRDVHHTPFVYFGEISLVDCVERIDKPSEFLFSLQALNFYTAISANDQIEMPSFNRPMLEVTEQVILRRCLNSSWTGFEDQRVGSNSHENLPKPSYPTRMESPRPRTPTQKPNPKNRMGMASHSQRHFLHPQNRLPMALPR